MSRIIQIEEKLVVGSPESGHELLASMVGQYLALAYGVKDVPSVTVASQAIQLVEWNSLIPSTLGFGYVTETDKQSWQHVETNYKGFAEKIVYVKRDPKDAVALLVQTTHQGEITDEICKAAFNRLVGVKARLESLGGEFTTVDFNDLVERPQVVLTKTLHMLRPIPDMDISLELVEKVVTESNVRGLRFDSNSAFAEKAGSYANILTREQAVLIDEAAKKAGL